MLNTFFLWLKARHLADHPAENRIVADVVVAAQSHTRPGNLRPFHLSDACGSKTGRHQKGLSS
jgi:hypothetical protein